MHDARGAVPGRRRGVQRNGVVHPGRGDHARAADARPRSSSGWPGRPGSTRGPTACPPRRSRRRSGATRSCTSSSTATSGTTRRTGRTSGSSASAPPSSTCTATRTTRSSATTTTVRRCAYPARPGSATWARSASASSTGTRTTARARSSRRWTSGRRAGYLGGGNERAELGLTGGPELVVTNLAVLDFHPESKRMRLRLGPSGHDRRAGAGGDGLRAAPPGRRRAGDGGADGGAGADAARGHRPRRNVQARGRGEELMEIEFGAPGHDHAAGRQGGRVRARARRRTGTSRSGGRAT